MQCRQASREGLKRFGIDFGLEVPEDPNAFRLKPLPFVPGVKFRGLSGRMDKDMVMMQCAATLFKFVSTHNTNRLLSFRMHVQNEICDVGLVCQGKPKVLEYITWIIDTLMMDYIDKFPDEVSAASRDMCIQRTPPVRPFVYLSIYLSACLSV